MNYDSSQPHKHCHKMAAAAHPLYESADEIGRLTIAIGRMNVDNVSPIFGVGKAKDLGFKESLEIASVSNTSEFSSNHTSSVSVD